MKRTCIGILYILLLLCHTLPAHAEQENLLSGLVIQDGWLSGTLKGYFGTENIEKDIKIDCPLPEAPYPAEIISLSEESVTKAQMQAALKAIGQSTEGKFISQRGYASYTGDWNTEAAAEITHEEAAEQAIRIGLAYFDALGVDVERTPFSVTRPYDYDAYIARNAAYFEHRYSDTTYFMDYIRADWKRRMKYTNKQAGYTTVSFYLLVDGMRLGDSSYPAGFADEPDAWTSDVLHTSATVTVSDSGVLVDASCGLYAIQSRRPLSSDDPSYVSFVHALQSEYSRSLDPYYSARSWQEALSIALTDGDLSYAQEEPYMNKTMTEPITAYGAQCVVTGIRPFLRTIARNEWAPTWCVDHQLESADGYRWR